LSADWKTLTTGETGIDLQEMISGQERVRIKAPQVSFDCATFSPDGQILAATVYSIINHTSCITLWDVFSGKEIRQLSGFQGGIRQLFFSPDGKKLASVGSDTTILIWDVSGSKSQYASADLSADWKGLRSEGTKAWQALGRLIGADGATVTFLKEQLQPAEMPKGKNIDQLVKDLDDATFSVREQASKDLEKLEALAQPQLEKALASKPSAELKRSAEMLLAKISRPVSSPEKLQMLRGIEILEHIGTPEAQEVLETLSQGAPEARVTREAKASLERLAKRAQVKP
jgi:hypothetical protein